jgi:hypothetical protein
MLNGISLATKLLPQAYPCFLCLASSGRNALTCRYRNPAGVEHRQQIAEAGTEPRLGKARCAVSCGGFGIGGGKLSVGGRYESIAAFGVTA